MKLNSMILVIDDEILLAAALAEVIRDDGYEVLEANDGAAGLEVIKNYRDQLALIICDISMPKMTGIELLTQSLREGLRVPFVMVTAHDDSARITECLRLGAIDYIVKPFSSSNVRNQVPLWIEIGLRTTGQVSEESSGELANLMRLRNARVAKTGS